MPPRPRTTYRRPTPAVMARVIVYSISHIIGLPPPFRSLDYRDYSGVLYVTDLGGLGCFFKAGRRDVVPNFLHRVWSL